jgi:hypothetical protein
MCEFFFLFSFSPFFPCYLSLFIVHLTVKSLFTVHLTMNMKASEATS